MKVINEAFVQSGVMPGDLQRIKSNIFTDCTEILQALKAAFIFPLQMREIQVMKDTAEGELNDCREAVGPISRRQADRRRRRNRRHQGRRNAE
jgi:hypothetical protein